jgi:hypothetical protein
LSGSAGYKVLECKASEPYGKGFVGEFHIMVRLTKEGSHLRIRYAYANHMVIGDNIMYLKELSPINYVSSLLKSVYPKLPLRYISDISKRTYFPVVSIW